MIHPTADIQTKRIGEGTHIWQFTIVLSGSQIGNNCNINCDVFIENDVRIGNNVTVKSGVQLWDGITIEDNVFVGPNVSFTNDNFPRSKNFPITFKRTIIKNGASIGAGAVIRGGVEIGSFSLVGAGAVVLQDIPDKALVVGNPARIIGWVSEKGSKMKKIEKNLFIDETDVTWEVIDSKLYRK